MDIEFTKSVVFAVDGFVVRAAVTPSQTSFAVAVRSKRTKDFTWRSAERPGESLARTLALFDEEWLESQRQQAKGRGIEAMLELGIDAQRCRERFAPVPWSEVESLDLQGAELLASDALAIAGAKGGRVTSEAKAAAVRANGAKGGRPLKGGR